jgi:thiol:disulfide interchange protein
MQRAVRFMVSVGIVVLPIALTGASAIQNRAAAPPTVAEDRYDPARDADKDIQDAVAKAKQDQKRVLVEVGGEWCSWCHIMHRYFAEHAELRQIRDANFVVVRVNFSPENKNEKVLSRYPQIPGYPHIFVLDTDGRLLKSQDTSELEAGPSYDLAKFTAFLKQWSPAHK